MSRTVAARPSRTIRQKVALGLIRDRETAQCISGPTWADRYTAFVNYKTAEALRARGLVTIGPRPDFEIRLVAGGGSR